MDLEVVSYALLGIWMASLWSGFEYCLFCLILNVDSYICPVWIWIWSLLSGFVGGLSCPDLEVIFPQPFSCQQ